jgi:hypothetical protein
MKLANEVVEMAEMVEKRWRVDEEMRWAIGSRLKGVRRVSEESMGCADMEPPHYCIWDGPFNAVQHQSPNIANCFSSLADISPVLIHPFLVCPPVTDAYSFSI